MNQKSSKLTLELGKMNFSAALTCLMFVLLIASCSRREQHLDTAWSIPEPFAFSKQALNSSFSIVNLDGEPVCVDDSDYYFLGTSGTNWTKKTFPPPTGTEKSFILADPASTRFLFFHGEVQGGELHIYRNTHSEVAEGKLESIFTFCAMHKGGMGIQKIYDRSLTLDSKALFGEIKRPGPEQAIDPIWKQQYGSALITPSMGWLCAGVILGSEIYIPYTVECSSFYGSQHESGGSGPSQTGLLHSSGDHSHWKTIKLFDVYTHSQGTFATRENLYCLAQRSGESDRKAWGLWCVRIPLETDAHQTQEIVAPAYRFDIYGSYSAVTDRDTIHLVWLDGRHVSGGQLWALRTGTPDKVNLELYYRKRTDSTASWTKEVLLSKGLRYVFAPQMAVEGNNIVVVWSGYQKGYGEFVPSDIYFTTSQDSGKTWTPTARATDNQKSGFISGRPSVALHNGIIHLFYIQGKLEDHNLGGGLRQLRQDAWPIIYQHRPFSQK